MAQTEQALSAINTLLADNASGAISPQDVRDAVASLQGYGGLHLSIGGAGATMAGVGTSPSLIDVFDTIPAQSVDTNTNGTSANLAATYALTVGATGIYRFDFWASFSSSATNRTVTFQLFKDAVAAQGNLVRFVATNDVGAAAMSGLLSLTAGEVLDMRAFLSTGTATLTFQGAGFLLHRVG
jgi:hypothetical protein